MDRAEAHGCRGEEGSMDNARMLGLCFRIQDQFTKDINYCHHYLITEGRKASDLCCRNRNKLR